MTSLISRRHRWSALLLLPLLLMTTVFAGTVSGGESIIRTRGAQSDFDASHDYYISLIELALEKTAGDDPDTSARIEAAPFMSQQRALDELKAGRLIDIYWAGTSQKREAELRAIRIPLTRGLLGFRVFILHQALRPTFTEVMTLDQLKKLSLCQGAHWPDTDIMLAAGLHVVPNSVYENMFRQVNAQRCSAFPRGVQEAQSEIAARTEEYPELELYSDLILYYPFPMYLFLNKQNEALAARIERGLERAIDDGSFDRHLREHPVTRHLFPLDDWMNARYLKIENPFLPADTEIKNTRYWISPP